MDYLNHNECFNWYNYMVERFGINFDFENNDNYNMGYDVGYFDDGEGVSGFEDGSDEDCLFWYGVHVGFYEN